MTDPRLPPQIELARALRRQAKRNKTLIAQAREADRRADMAERSAQRTREAYEMRMETLICRLATGEMP